MTKAQRWQCAWADTASDTYNELRELYLAERRDIGYYGDITVESYRSGEVGVLQDDECILLKNKKELKVLIDKLVVCLSELQKQSKNSRRGKR